MAHDAEPIRYCREARPLGYAAGPGKEPETILDRFGPSLSSGRPSGWGSWIGTLRAVIAYMMESGTSQARRKSVGSMPMASARRTVRPSFLMAGSLRFLPARHPEVAPIGPVRPRRAASRAPIHAPEVPFVA